jgi:hypothetical protein
MSQASWNLCPQDIQYNTACYDDPDDAFSTISGSLSKPMPDLPDGDWSIVLKRDIFQKVSTATYSWKLPCCMPSALCSSAIIVDVVMCLLITVRGGDVQQDLANSQPALLPAALSLSRHLQTSGAVRDTVKLSNSAFWYKVYIAAAAAAAEQVFELTLLNKALGLLKQNMVDSLPAVWNATNQAHRDAFDVQQMRNASCICTNGTLALLGTFGFTDAATYLSTNCSGEPYADLFMV